MLIPFLVVAVLAVETAGIQYVGTLTGRRYVGPPPIPKQEKKVESQSLLAEHLGKVVNIRPVEFSNRLMRHRNLEVWIDIAQNSDLFVQDSSFKIVPGLSGTGISFQSINYQDHYLRHKNFDLYLHRNDKSPLFKQDASFTPRSAFVGSGISFESVNYPGHFIRHYKYRVILSKDDGLAQFKKDASWIIVRKEPAPIPDEKSNEASAFFRKDASWSLVRKEVAPIPVLTEELGKTVRLQPVNFPSRLMRHRQFRLWIDKAQSSNLFVKDSSFKLVPGLAGTGISFRSINYPDRYLRHSNFKVYLHRNDNSQLFKKDATFIPRPGFAGSGISFKSFNYPRRFIRHQSSRIIMSINDGSDLFKKDSSWNIISQDSAPTTVQPQTQPKPQTTLQPIPGTVISMIKQMNGKWTLKFPTASFDLAISNGNIVVNGQPINLLASDNQQYPVTQGWLKFINGGVTYFFQISTSGVVNVVTISGRLIFSGSVIQPSQLTVGRSPIHGSLNYKGSHKFVISPFGRIKMDGNTIQLTPSTSTNPGYKASAGWMTFTYKSLTFFFRDANESQKEPILSLRMRGEKYFQVYPYGGSSSGGPQSVYFNQVNGGTCQSVSKNICDLLAQSRGGSLQQGASDQPAGCYKSNGMFYFNDNLKSQKPLLHPTTGICVKGTEKGTVTTNGPMNGYYDQPSKHQHE